MTILSAIAQGYTEEKWQEEQQRSLKALTNQPSDKKAAHADATNRYEQLVSNLKDLTLWPW
jgi:site-specific DNA-adenine methylase